MNKLKVFLVDDEELALKRLNRLLLETGRVEVLGRSTCPKEASKLLIGLSVDLLFLDIEMPGMNGFELLAGLPTQPLTIFATAYSRYALEAFETHSIDYLVKPIERERLAKALDKAERLLEGKQVPGWQAMVNQLAQALRQPAPLYPMRIASKVGDKVELIDLDRVTHFYAQDKLTWAATGGKTHIVDETITELEQKLDAARFFRIHRSTLVNLAYVQELHAWLGGGVLLRLNDQNRTELQVARERVTEMKDKLGLT